MERIKVLKTYKIYIGGKFPRTESGRYYMPEVKGKGIANVCLSSRKDVRNAIKAARGAQKSWADRAAFNRGQILYRIAEMMEGRYDQFVQEMQLQGLTKARAEREVQLCIDRWIYYAGWSDKYQQVFSAVNPVSSPHFNFSVLEPSGVFFITINDNHPLLSLVSALAPMIVSGNTAVVLANKEMPLCAITLAEVLQTSDVPAGVVNILTGDKDELLDHYSKHLDVNGIVYVGEDKDYVKKLKIYATTNLKRVSAFNLDWKTEKGQNPFFIKKGCEIKTTWHPIEVIGAAGSGY